MTKYKNIYDVVQGNAVQNVTSRCQFRNLNAVYGSDTCWIIQIIFEIKANSILSLFQTLIKYFVLNIKFEIILFYVIVRCVTKFKTNINMNFIFSFYRSLSKYRKYRITNIIL